VGEGAGANEEKDRWVAVWCKGTKKKASKAILCPPSLAPFSPSPAYLLCPRLASLLLLVVLLLLLLLLLPLPLQLQLPGMDLRLLPLRLQSCCVCMLLLVRRRVGVAKLGRERLLELSAPFVAPVLRRQGVVVLAVEGRPVVVHLQGGREEGNKGGGGWWGKRKRIKGMDENEEGKARQLLGGTYHAWAGAVVPHPLCLQESLLHLLLLLLLAVVHGPVVVGQGVGVCVCVSQFDWQKQRSGRSLFLL